MSQYTNIPVQQCSTSRTAASSDFHKKRMPNIITYFSDDEENSDDDFDCDVEDSTPLAELRLAYAPFPAPDYRPPTSINAPQSSFIDLSICPSSSDEEEEVLGEESITSHCDSMTVQKWLTSNMFKKLQKSSSQNPGRPRLPHSFVVFFFHSLLHTPKKTIDGQSFRDISDVIVAEWNKLSSEERMEYRRRGVNAGQSYARHLANHKAKLLTLDEVEVPKCETIGCVKPVEYDPRWSLQYCSAECLHSHCKSVFARRFQTTTEENEVVDVDANDDEVELINVILPTPAKRPTLSTDHLQGLTLRDCSVTLRKSDIQCEQNIYSSENFLDILHPTGIGHSDDKLTELNVLTSGSKCKKLPFNQFTGDVFQENLFERLQRHIPSKLQ